MLTAGVKSPPDSEGTVHSISVLSADNIEHSFPPTVTERVDSEVKRDPVRVTTSPPARPVAGLEEKHNVKKTR